MFFDRQPREFSACPLYTNDDVNNWLKHFEVSAPLVCQSVLVSKDPVSEHIILMKHISLSPSSAWIKNQSIGGHAHCQTSFKEVCFCNFRCVCVCPGFGSACGAYSLFQSPWRRRPLLHWHHTGYSGVPGLLYACRVRVPRWQAQRDPRSWTWLKKGMRKSNNNRQSTFSEHWRYCPKGSDRKVHKQNHVKIIHHGTR